MYVCMYVRVICIICMHFGTGVYACNICMYAYVCVCVCMYVYACMYVYVCVYVLN